MKNAIFQYYLQYEGGDTFRKQGMHYEADGVPEWAQYSIKYFTEYAKKHGVDYFYFTDKFVDATSNYFESTRVYKDPFFDQYDKVLYLDVDVMPKNMEANIFDNDVVDIAGWSEWKHPDLAVPVTWSASRPLIQRFADFGSSLVQSKTNPSKIRMINSGVVLWSKQARLKARAQFDDHEKWFSHKNALLDTTLDSRVVGHSSFCLDQPFFNAMWNKNKFDVLELPIEWNRFPTKDENRPCNFAHYLQNYRFNIPTIFGEL